MFRQILVAYDGSDHGDTALRRGAELAALAKAELHVLGIVVTTGFMALAEGNGSLDLWAVERARLEQAQAAAIHGLSVAGARITSHIQEGDPGAEIVKYAEEIGADLVVIGHSGKGVVARWIDGSVGAELLGKLPCSVLIVKGRG